MPGEYNRRKTGGRPNHGRMSPRRCARGLRWHRFCPCAANCTARPVWTAMKTRANRDSVQRQSVSRGWLHRVFSCRRHQMRNLCDLPRRLPTDGGGLRAAQAHQPASRAVVCRVAPGATPNPTTSPRTTTVVFEGATGSRARRGLPASGAVTRSGDGRSHRSSGQPTSAEDAQRIRATTGRAERAAAPLPRSGPARTSTSGNKNPGSPARKGRTC